MACFNLIYISTGPYICMNNNKIMEPRNIIYFKIAQLEDEKIQKSILFETAEILDEEDENLMAVEDFKEFEVIYSFLPSYKSERFKNLLEKFGILIDHKDITEDILMAREKGDEFIKTFKDENYRKVLERFLEKNLSVDMILDKINEQGIQSLSEIDKGILNKA